MPVLRALQQEGRARGGCGCRSLEPGAWSPRTERQLLFACLVCVHDHLGQKG